MNLSKLDPLVLIQTLSNVVANNVSKLSMINDYGVGSFPVFYILCPGRTNFGADFIPGSATIVLTWYFKSFCFFCGSGVRKV